MVSYKLTTLLVAATLSLGVFAAVDNTASRANVRRATKAGAKAGAGVGAGAGAGARGVGDLPVEDLGMGPPPSKGRKSVKPAGGAAGMEDEALEAAPPTKIRKAGKAAKKDENLETDSEDLEGADVDGMDEASLEDEDDEEEL